MGDIGTEPSANPILVDVEWVKRHQAEGGVRIIDARTATDYAKGHVRNAINIELGEIVRSRGGLPAMCPSENYWADLLGRKGISNDDCLVLYDNFGGLFAGRLLWTLEHFGHRNLRVFDGSIKRWRDAGERFVKAVPKNSTTRYKTVHDLSNLATKEWIVAHINDPKVAFLDVRKPGEFSGKVAFGRRGGHIPGAAHVHWVDAIDPSSGRYKPTPVLCKMYLSKGIVPEKEIATYCWMGMRASHGYMMLRLLGYPRVRMYDSSWSEWGDTDDCAVEVSR